MHINSPADLVALDAQAVRTSMDLVTQATAEDLARPTPCADYVVHAWDLARTLDLPVYLDPALLDAAHSVARSVPRGQARLEPGAAFAPEVAWSGGSRLDQIVAILGRSPDWQRPRAGGATP